MTRTESRELRIGSLFGIGLLLVACSPPAGAPPSAPAEKAAASPVRVAVLAEADCTNPKVRVQVTEVVKSGAEAITVKLRLTNADATASVSIADAFAEEPGDIGSLSGVYVLDAEGRKKMYVLRDDRGQPQCSTGLGALPPHGEIEAWGRYPVPSTGATRVTVQVPGLAAFRDLPVSDPPDGTGSARPSY